MQGVLLQTKSCYLRWLCCIRLSKHFINSRLKLWKVQTNETNWDSKLKDVAHPHLLLLLINKDFHQTSTNHDSRLVLEAIIKALISKSSQSLIRNIPNHVYLIHPFQPNSIKSETCKVNTHPIQVISRVITHVVYYLWHISNNRSKTRVPQLNSPFTRHESLNHPVNIYLSWAWGE